MSKTNLRSDDVPLSPSPATMLRVENVSKAFGATQALKDVSFDVSRGTIHALLGSNGSGKSTLIKVLAGTYSADAGRFAIAGETWEATKMTPASSQAAGLRFVHQQNSTFGTLTVAENLHIGHGFPTTGRRRIRWGQVKAHTQALLDRFEIDATPGQPMSELGRARQTMIAIARALQDQDDPHSRILVLDEPTSSLPAVEVDILFDALKRYASQAQTIMFVTHRFAEVMEIADRATMLRDGRVVGEVERSDINEDRLTEMMVGRALPPVVPSRDVGVAHTTALMCDKLRGGALRDASLSLRRGEILGVAGLVGSGRSTLLRMLFGPVRPESGAMKIEGEPYAPRTVADAIAAGVAYVPEDRICDASFLGLPVADNISLTVLGGYYRRGLLRGRAERQDARELLARYGVKAASERALFSSLSGGNQQKVILARWLRRRPRVLLLDEPMQGVDIGARADIRALIRQATAEGTSVILVSSEFEELEQLCDRALIMREGTITGDVSGSDLSADHLEHILQGSHAR